MDAPWLLLQDQRKTYLLAKDQHNFYLILVDKFLTWETEEWLMQQGISQELLEELPLNVEILPRNQLRGIALSGTLAGESLYFYPKNGKRRHFTFSDDYLEERIDAFFEGVERYLAPSQPPKKKKTGGDWRTERQDPEVFRKTEYVCIGVTVLSFVFALGYCRNQNAWWYTPLLLTNAAAVALTILYPQYFTLIYEEKKKKQTAWNMVWSLYSQVLLMVFLPWKNWLDERTVWISMIVCGVSAAVVMGLLSEEFRRAKVWLLAVFFFVGVLGQGAVGHINEVYDFSQPESYVLEVEDLDHSESRRSSHYDCTVTLPDGREVDLYISRDFYRSLRVGEAVRVEVGTGCLGIEYANAYPAE